MVWDYAKGVWNAVTGQSGDSGSPAATLLDSQPVKDQQAFAKTLQTATTGYQPTAAPQIGNDGSVSGANFNNPLPAAQATVDAQAKAAADAKAVSDHTAAAAYAQAYKQARLNATQTADAHFVSTYPVGSQEYNNEKAAFIGKHIQDSGIGPPPEGYDPNIDYSSEATNTQAGPHRIPSDPNAPATAPIRGTPPGVINTGDHSQGPGTSQAPENYDFSGQNVDSQPTGSTSAAPTYTSGPSMGPTQPSGAPISTGGKPSIYGGPAAQAGSVKTAGIADTTYGVADAGANVTAQQIGPMGPINTQRVNPTSIQGQVGGVSAQQIGAQQINAPRGITSQDVTAQQIGDIGPVNGSTANVQGPGADAQAFALSLAKDQALGVGPSAAQAEYRLAADQAAKRALAMSATNQTANAGSALSSGIASMLEGQQTAATQGAALRAQEQQAGAKLFSQQATDTGQQNIDVAKANQSNALAAATTTAQNKLDTLKANQDAALKAGDINAANALKAQIQTAANELDAAKSNQDADLKAKTANQGANLSAQTATLQAKLESLKADQATALAAGQSNAANDLAAQMKMLEGQIEVSKANQAADLSAQTTNKTVGADVSKTNAQLQTTAGIADMQAKLQSALKDADIASSMQQFNAAASNDMTKFGATQALDQAKANLQAQLQNKGYDQQFIESLINSTLTGQQGPINAITAQNTLDAQGHAADQAFLAGLISTGAKVVAS